MDSWNVAFAAIRSGHLIAFATDTVYGIACDPFNSAAIDKLYQAKARDRLKAIPLLISSAQRLQDFSSEVPPTVEALAARFWPGALTVVVPKAAGLPPELGGGDTIAIRVPDRPALLHFLEVCGGALATSSANLSGQPDAVTAEQAATYLGEHVAVIIDGGTTPGGIPSTVINCAVTPPEILRVGAIPEADILSALVDAGGAGGA